MTTDQMITALRGRWGETDSANSSIPDSMLVDFFNQMQMELCLEGGILLTCARFTTVLAQEEYNLATDHLKVQAVFIEGAAGRKHEIFPISVNDRDPESRGGDCWRYWLWGGNQSSANVYTIGLTWNVPDNNTDVIHVYYRQKPNTMVASVPGPMVNPEVDVQWQYAMLDGALARVYERLGPEFASLAQLRRNDWQGWKNKAMAYTPDMSTDFPRQRRDTGGYSVEAMLG